MGVWGLSGCVGVACGCGGGCYWEGKRGKGGNCMCGTICCQYHMRYKGVQCVTIHKVTEL